jgi:predicted CXXCH cytochrome family protein
MKKALLGCLFVALFVSGSWARKHPVPLDANTDSAKCAECHSDKSKGPAVHSAMQMGCTSCHEVRVVKSRDKKKEDVTRVKLIKATPLSLCLSCHENKKGSAGNSVPHAPVTRNCLTCHDPHSSPNKNQLKKVTSGDKKNNLCLSCHFQGMSVPEKGSRHAALDMGCDACHVTHKTGPADKRDNRFHLTKDSPALCLDCHDVNDKKLNEAHHNQPFAAADCLSCHDPHLSAMPKLARRFQHSPFEAGACDSCHSAPKDGKVVLTQTDVRALCVTCHDEEAKKMEKAKVQHPGALGECIACHSPHASAYPYLMKPDPVNACLACHAEQAEMLKTKPVLHRAAFGDGCYTCHDGHGGDRPKLLRASVENNALCLECHSSKRSPKVDEKSGAVTIFGGNVRLPSSYFARLASLDLGRGDAFGHPTSTHPVIATIDRSDPEKRRSMGCVSCHQPHASSSRGMLVTEAKDGSMALCARCHTDANGLVLPNPQAANADAAQSPAQTGKKGKKK